MPPSSSGLTQWALFIVLALGLGGCAGLSGNLRDTPDLGERLAEAPPPAMARAEVVDAPDIRTEGTGQDQAAGAADPDSSDARPEISPAAEADARASLGVAPRWKPAQALLDALEQARGPRGDEAGR